MFFSRGIILFAMLNGRLPFNDSQLMEMEEDMKMQRLRFERIVSFGKLLKRGSYMSAHVMCFTEFIKRVEEKR